MAIIVGVDPGSRFLGVGVIAAEGDKVTHLFHETIEAKSPHYAGRLLEVGEGLSRVLATFRPQIAVVEKVFFAKNADSAFKLGQARGVAVYECARAGVFVVEYAAREIKKGITGSGAATKEQVQRLIMNLLKISQIPKLDATDALALAYHHGTQLAIEERFARAERRNPRGLGGPHL